MLAGARRCLCVWLSRGLVVGGVDNIEDRPDHPITCYGGVCVGLAAVSSIICTEHQVISLAHLCRNFCSFDPRLYLGDDSNITGPASRTQGPGGPPHHPHTVISSWLDRYLLSCKCVIILSNAYYYSLVYNFVDISTFIYYFCLMLN